MTFNFAELFARGIQQADQRQQFEANDAFRRLVEARIADQGQQGLNLQAEAGARQQQQIDNQASQFDRTFDSSQAQRDIDNAFRSSQAQFQNTLASDQLGLARDQFGLQRSQFVDIAGPNGQTGAINIRDLLSNRIARGNLRLGQRRQDFLEQPLDLSNLGAFSDARTGDFSRLPDQIGAREGQAFG